MTKLEKEKLILEEVASIVNNLAFIHKITYYYEPFCSMLEIARNVSVKERICCDVDSIKIEIINAIKNNNKALLDEMYNNFINTLINKEINEITDEEEKRLIKYIETINTQLNTEADDEISDVKTIDELVDFYNSVHFSNIEKIEKIDVSKIKDIQLEIADYKDLKIKDNSILVLYEPFEKSNILEDKFNHIQFRRWVESISKDRRCIILYLGYEKITNSLVEYTDFSNIIALNKKHNLKLFVSGLEDTEEFEF